MRVAIHKWGSNSEMRVTTHKWYGKRKEDTLKPTHGNKLVVSGMVVLAIFYTLKHRIENFKTKQAVRSSNSLFLYLFRLELCFWSFFHSWCYRSFFYSNWCYYRSFFYFSFLFFFCSSFFGS